ncbi:DeoR family transcriptional regulator [Faecalispora sporosphaeroides]|uniref:DeoR family transcriptional regulator n=1 Tax=Faecalispora sporosphaeroides TaxID=1549 RepID=UPI002DD8ED4B|nr:DeoR family transcriptional regulator [Faecalispora sporosphaeroides]
MMEMLLDKASVKVSELAQIFDVSIETIRRDLDFLGKQGRLIKVYGGAILEHVVAQEVNQIRSVQNAESTLMEW